MLSQLLNIKWSTIDIMLIILIILGIILSYKSIGFILRFYKNIKRSKIPVERNPMIKITEV